MRNWLFSIIFLFLALPPLMARQGETPSATRDEQPEESIGKCCRTAARECLPPENAETAAEGESHMRTSSADTGDGTGSLFDLLSGLTLHGFSFSDFTGKQPSLPNFPQLQPPSGLSPPDCVRC